MRLYPDSYHWSKTIEEFAQIKINSAKENHVEINQGSEIQNKISNELINVIHTEYKNIPLRITKDSSIEEIVNRYHSLDEIRMNNINFSESALKDKIKSIEQLHVNQMKCEQIMKFLPLLRMDDTIQVIEWIKLISPYTTMKGIEIKYRIYEAFRNGGYKIYTNPDYKDVKTDTKEGLETYAEMMIEHFIYCIYSNKKLPKNFYDDCKKCVNSLKNKYQ